MIKIQDTHLEVAELDFCRGRDDIGLVDPAEGDAVDLEGAGDQEQARVELLEEDDALSAETACEEDEDGAGGDGRAQGGGLGRLPALLGHGDVLCGVVPRRLGCRH